MRFVVLLLPVLLAACHHEPVPTPTVGDAVHEIASATCARYIGCGWAATERYDLCVAESEAYLCSQFDCSLPYPRYAEVVECGEWYAGLDCSAVAHVCVLP